MSKSILQEAILNAHKSGYKAFIPFITCGYPDLKTSEEIIIALSKSGADIIELGIPFSDPTAEGEVIEEASFKALQNNINTDDIFMLVEKVRKMGVKTPLVFMTYANVVFSYGSEKFCKKASECGVSGLVLPDVPFEEMDEFLEFSKKYNLDLISFVAPTSNRERIIKIAKEASGFIYCVSSLGVTGERSSFSNHLESIIKIIKAESNIPVCIGFGIANKDSAALMGEISDGVIIGSAIVKNITQSKQDAPKVIYEFAKSIKEALKIKKD